MQILKDNSRKSGDILVFIDNLDDLWVLYNIIRPGDKIKGRTNRRVVVREGETGRRQSMVLKLDIKKAEFHEFTNKLRVLGQIEEGPSDLISIGDHHTFNLEPGKKYRIFKEKWYKNDIDRIRKNLARSKISLILCIAIESGLANIALLSDYSLTPITEVSKNIPGKRFAKQQFEKAITKFYESVKTVIEENIQRNPLSLIILCGPGFIKEDFMQYLKEKSEVIRSNNVSIRNLNASSGELSSIYEILHDGSLASQQADFRFAVQARFMSEFIEHLGKDDGKSVYGLDEVLKCSESGAVETLLVCDTLLRVSNIELREKIEDALNDTENQGGEVHILSTRGPPGQQLDSYGKIAAILRFRIDY